MKKTLFALLISVIVFGSSNFANAQSDPRTPVEKATAYTKVMTCELGLTANEIPKVYEVNLRIYKSLDSAVQKLHHHYGRINAIGRKLDKERDVAMRRTMTADHYSFYLRIVQRDLIALKETKGCRAEE